MPLPSAIYSLIPSNNNIIEKSEKIEWLCASNIDSFNAVDARVLEIEHDTAKTVCAERSVTSAIVSTIKKKQNLREAHHIEDSDTVLKEVTCLWSTIECAKRKTAEDVRTINDEHISRYFTTRQR